ncbi:MAG: ADP-glyceromanno-heptose 6-epimerase [Planctomycetes bacterium]|nr:ADP-glyceromanno-heptose 6-epimerase [Planctomycetota bacterium]
MIVVTGASGFIGSNVAICLAERGETVVAADRYPPEEAGAAARHRYLNRTKIKAFVDRDDLHVWLANAGKALRGVIHLGACSDTTVTDREYVMRVNYEYTRALWNFCAREGVPLIYASSAATYGDGARGWDDERDPHLLQPLNLYGESKHRFDLWALEQPQEKQPPRWAGLKYFNVYGPNEKHKARMASVVFHSFYQIRSFGKVTLFQSHKEGIPHGGQKRDFVYVGDAVDATLHFFDTPASAQAPNGLYNVGTGAARSFEDLAQAVFSALGLPPKIEYIPTPEEIRDKYQYFTQAETAKLKRAGFSRAFKSLEEGVRLYVERLQGGGGAAGE